MNAQTDIKPISYLKQNTASVVSQVNETHSPVYITQNGEAKAVVVDTESYQKLVDRTKIMTLINQSEQDIAAGRVIPQEEVFAELDRMIDEIEQRKK